MNPRGNGTVTRYFCDGCASWADEDVSLDTLLKDWHWKFVDGEPEDLDEFGPMLLCQECQ